MIFGGVSVWGEFEQEEKNSKLKHDSRNNFIGIYLILAMKYTKLFSPFKETQKQTHKLRMNQT